MGILQAGKAITSIADALDYKLNPTVRKVLDPVGTLATMATGAAEKAMGLPQDSIAIAADPKGFVKGLAKDAGKDYVKKSFKDSEEIPVEDMSPRRQNVVVGGSSYVDYGNGGDEDISNMEWEGDYKRGGQVKRKSSAKSAPKASSASRRGDGIAQRGKTKGRYV